MHILLSCRLYPCRACFQSQQLAQNYHDLFARYAAYAQLFENGCRVTKFIDCTIHGVPVLFSECVGLKFLMVMEEIDQLQYAHTTQLSGAVPSSLQPGLACKPCLQGCSLPWHTHLVLTLQTSTSVFDNRSLPSQSRTACLSYYQEHSLCCWFD